MDSNELFSEIILELYKNPLNRGKLDRPSLEASGGNPICGDRTVIYLKLKGSVISDCRFEANGCAISVASASLLSERVKGKTISQVLAISPGELFEELGGVIQTRIKCSLLPLSILKEALRRHQKDSSVKKVLNLTI